MLKNHKSISNYLSPQELVDYYCRQNNAFYRSALSFNFNAVEALLESGIPKNSKDEILKNALSSVSSDMSNKLRDKLDTSYKAIISDLLFHMVKDESFLQMLKFCIGRLSPKVKELVVSYHALASSAIEYGNIDTFDWLCSHAKNTGQSILNAEHLLFYIHKARQNPTDKKYKVSLATNYIESFNLDWKKSKHALVRCANINRMYEDFVYFYDKRKTSLKENSNNLYVLSKELKQALESFLKKGDLKENLQSNSLKFFREVQEFKKTKNPYFSEHLIIKTAVKIAKKMDLSFLTIHEYILEKCLLDKSFTTSLTKLKIEEINDFLQKCILNHKLQITLQAKTKKTLTVKI